MRLWRLPQELGSPLRVLEQNLHTGVPVDVAGEAKIPCWSRFHVPSIFSASWGGGAKCGNSGPREGGSEEPGGPEPEQRLRVVPSDWYHFCLNGVCSPGSL